MLLTSSLDGTIEQRRNLHPVELAQVDHLQQQPVPGGHVAEEPVRGPSHPPVVHQADVQLLAHQAYIRRPRDPVGISKVAVRRRQVVALVGTNAFKACRARRPVKELADSRLGLFFDPDTKNLARPRRKAQLCPACNSFTPAQSGHAASPAEFSNVESYTGGFLSPGPSRKMPPGRSLPSSWPTDWPSESRRERQPGADRSGLRGLPGRPGRGRGARHARAA
jgi:hypothetical protein